MNSYGEKKAKGMSKFERSLFEKGIRYIVASKSSTNNGKIERFYGTLEAKARY